MVSRSVIFINDCVAPPWQIMIFYDNRVQSSFYHTITKFIFLFKSLSATSRKLSAIFHTIAWFFLSRYLQVTWWAIGQWKGRNKHRIIKKKYLNSIEVLVRLIQFCFCLYYCVGVSHQPQSFVSRWTVRRVWSQHKWVDWWSAVQCYETHLLR